MRRELLTEKEHEAVALSGRLSRLIGEIIGEGGDPGVIAADRQEATALIHAVQQMILTQAAARAYRDRYRLLGARPWTPPDLEVTDQVESDGRPWQADL